MVTSFFFDSFFFTFYLLLVHDEKIRWKKNINTVLDLNFNNLFLNFFYLFFFSETSLSPYWISFFFHSSFSVNLLRFWALKSGFFFQCNFIIFFFYCWQVFVEYLSMVFVKSYCDTVVVMTTIKLFFSKMNKNLAINENIYLKFIFNFFNFKKFYFLYTVNFKYLLLYFFHLFAWVDIFFVQIF